MNLRHSLELPSVVDTRHCDITQSFRDRVMRLRVDVKSRAVAKTPLRVTQSEDELVHFLPN